MSYYTISYNYDYKKNVIALDMDGTIIIPKSGRKFPKNKDDWKFIFNSNTRLKDLSKNNSIVIITNQLGISRNKTTIEDITHKIDSIVQELDISVMAMIASEDNNYRKPRIGFYQMLEQKYTENESEINSFAYIGDAAGRPKDHSDSDYKFLLNVAKYNPQINTFFKTPEDFFLDQSKNNMTVGGYQLDYKGKDSTKKILKKIEENKIKNKNYLYLVTGYPGSGKSTLVCKLEKKFKVKSFSKDKNGRKFNSLIKSSLKNEDDFIVEGLYYKLEQKKELKKMVGNSYQIINLNLDVSFDTAMHFNKYRSLSQEVKMIPNVVYYTYRKYYQDLDDITNIKVQPKIRNKEINRYFL